MFRFANPEFLYLYIGIPILIIAFWLIERGRNKRLNRFGSQKVMPYLIANFSTVSVRIKLVMMLLAYVFLVLTVTRPQVGSRLREVKSRGVEMMLVVDVSNSMMAEDFKPNRLEMTKYAIERLFEDMSQQERVGLIAFAGDASVELPITSDYRMARSFASRLSPSMVAAQGTNVGKALDLAMLCFSPESEASKVVILITDGEAHDAGAEAAAQRAAQLGIRIYTIGIGTTDGAPISIDGEYVKDEKGDMVVSKLNETMLQSIASQTDAGYVRASGQSIGLEQIVDSIKSMEQKELTTLRFEEYIEWFQYFLAIALFFVFGEFFISERKNKFLRKFSIFRR